MEQVTKKKVVNPILEDPFSEVETVTEKAIVADTQPEVYFEPVKWKGIVPTFRCKTCGDCNPNKDDMILHVLNHVPENKRDPLFEKLVKE